MDDFISAYDNIQKLNQNDSTIDDDVVMQAISSFKYIIGMNFIEAHTQELKVFIPYIFKAFKEKGSSFYLNDNMILDYPNSLLFEKYFLTSFQDDELSSAFSDIVIILIKDILNSKYDNIYPTNQDKSDYINILTDHCIPYNSFNIIKIIDIFKQNQNSDFYIDLYSKEILSLRNETQIKNIMNLEDNFEFILEIIKKDNYIPEKNKLYFLFKTIQQNQIETYNDNKKLNLIKDYFNNLSEQDRISFINYFIDETVDIFHYSWPMMSKEGAAFSKQEKSFLAMLVFTDQNEEEQVKLISKFLQDIDQSKVPLLHDRELYKYFIATQINIEKEKINNSLNTEKSPIEKQKRRI